jgi:hypothetical protein
LSLLTVEGLYNYDNTLFDGFNVPEGLVKQIAIDAILMRTRELEILYPDFTYLKNRITIWSNKYQINWKKLYDTTVLEYNPIENYDRMENWTDTDDETTSSVRDNTVKSTSTNEITNSVNITDKNTAFNSGLADHAKQITDGDTTENSSITNTEKENVNDGRTGNHTRTGRAHGNIGVTTSQQMIQSERDLVVFNLYDVIAESFIENFCLMVY